MQDRLLSILKELRGDIKRIRLLDEAATQLAVVLRLLSALGWNQFDASEVTPQFSIGAQKVDYALQLAGEPRVFIEVKRPRVTDLDSQEEQLLGYAFGRDVRLAVLTNGILWRFYLPPPTGSWSPRRCCTIDLSADKPRTIAGRLVRILSKENVASGKAFSTARRWYNRKIRQMAAEEALPKAWNQIIQESEATVIELLRETTKGACGTRPGIRQTKRFLDRHRDQLLLPEIPAKPAAGATPQQPNGNPGPPKQKKPIRGFVFLGVSYPVSTWKALLTTLSEIVYQKHAKRFELVLSEPTLRGPKWIYFSRDAEALHAPGKIGDSGYYVETKLSSDRAVEICRRLLRVFGYSDQDLTIQ
jgi:predicted type IV restriction endonuclease